MLLLTGLSAYFVQQTYSEDKVSVKDFDNPATRTAALKKWLERDEPSIRRQSLEEFGVSIRWMNLYPAPQSARPKAKVLVWYADSGFYNPDKYSPHPEELRRREKFAAPSSMGRAEELWFGPCSILLVDEKGVVPGSHKFIGCGVLGDFSGDGNLDLLRVQKLLLREKNGGRSGRQMVGDLIEICPLDPGEPTMGVWLANVRDSSTGVREFLFSIESKESESGAHLVLKPTGKAPLDIFEAAIFVKKEEVSLEFIREKNCFVVRNPNQISTIFQLEDSKVWESASIRDFVKTKLGFDEPNFAIGTNRWWELVDGFATFSSETNEPMDLVLPPNIATLSAAKAAIRTVDINRSDFHRKYYDLAFAGQEPLVKSGWVEVHTQPGWSIPVHSIWWLPENGSASCWEFRGTGSGIVNRLDIPRKAVSWWMSWLLSLNQVRSVPKYISSVDPNHFRIGGDDRTVINITVLSTSPVTYHVDYLTVPSLWFSIRGPYDREVASLIASASVAPPQWDLEGMPERKSIYEYADDWLKTEKLKGIPSPLLRHLILSIGTGGQMKFQTALEGLQRQLEQLTVEETRLWEIEKTIDQSVKERFPYWYISALGNDREEVTRYQSLDREVRKLRSSLSGNPGFELRSTVQTSLRMLKNFHDRDALSQWSQEGGPGADWAKERLGQL
ncbi:MAG: hypothetical protein P1V20_21455 [Verrucomicrobiales bacterium]|nr:hypothetical protein [Verrucomicrobiales bacterium]